MCSNSKQAFMHVAAVKTRILKYLNYDAENTEQNQLRWPIVSRGKNTCTYVPIFIGVVSAHGVFLRTNFSSFFVKTHVSNIASNQNKMKRLQWCIKVPDQMEYSFFLIFTIAIFGRHHKTLFTHQWLKCIFQIQTKVGFKLLKI